MLAEEERIELKTIKRMKGPPLNIQKVEEKTKGLIENTELGLSESIEVPRPNIQDNVEVKGVMENTELKLNDRVKDAASNIQEEANEIIENTQLKLKNRTVSEEPKDQPPNIQDDSDNSDEIIKRPAGCYIIR